MTTSEITPEEKRARTDGPIHTFFGLSYSNYQVLPRTLMQSMPVEWQERAVALFDELRDAFTHIDHPEGYEVKAATECQYSDLNDADMRLLGVSRPDAADGDGDEDDEDEIFDVYYDSEGTEHDGQDYVLIPCADPIPHYNRGRTFIEPLEPTPQPEPEVVQKRKLKATGDLHIVYPR